MDWEQAIKLVVPHIVKIETPTGFGTGFLTYYDDFDGPYYVIATAAPVVAHANEWGLPIKVTHGHTGTYEVLSAKASIDQGTATALVYCEKSGLLLPRRPLSLPSIDETCGSGVEIGWLGYPTVEANTPCFFAGRISARLESSKAYIIDGVGADGLGGAPVFRLLRCGNVQIVGVISPTCANRAAGKALSGPVRAHDVSFVSTMDRVFRTECDAQMDEEELD